ncbi:MAG: chemoreceptor glutamine deamidase CheD [Polyangiaceae bacterium]
MSRVPDSVPPRPLRGFEAMHRYWDMGENNWVAPVLPGNYYVTTSGEVISTVLGSCVSTCVRDPVIGIAGLNHFMLPNQGGTYQAADALRYGCFAVERLINELVKYGAARERLEIKIFGGGKVIPGMSDIGLKNIRFVHEYFETEGLVICAEDTGGTWARRVRYHTGTGRVLIQRLQTQETNQVVSREAELQRSLSIVPPPHGEVDLFD